MFTVSWVWQLLALMQLARQTRVYASMSSASMIWQLLSVCWENTCLYDVLDAYLMGWLALVFGRQWIQTGSGC